MTTKIIYEDTSDSWAKFIKTIQELIVQDSRKAACDIGGGATPVLSNEFVLEHQIDYTLLDISKTELEKAPIEYKKIVYDIASKTPPPFDQRFDIMFSRMLAEHVRDGKMFHKNVFGLLKDGGIAVHYFPTLYDLPFVVNKIIPESFSSSLLDVLLPGLQKRRGKFPAFYSWCFGPTLQMLSMLTGIGFEILEFRGFFGHPYFDRIPLLRSMYRAYLSYVIKYPNPHITSFAQVILRKPVIVYESVSG